MVFVTMARCTNIDVSPCTAPNTVAAPGLVVAPIFAASGMTAGAGIPRTKMPFEVVSLKGRELRIATKE